MGKLIEKIGRMIIALLLTADILLEQIKIKEDIIGWVFCIIISFMLMLWTFNLEREVKK